MRWDLERERALGLGEIERWDSEREVLWDRTIAREKHGNVHSTMSTKGLRTRVHHVTNVHPPMPTMMTHPCAPCPWKCALYHVLKSVEGKVPISEARADMRRGEGTEAR